MKDYLFIFNFASKTHGDQIYTLNTSRALEVITRIQAKLTGRDFLTNPDAANASEEGSSVEQQVSFAL